MTIANPNWNAQTWLNHGGELLESDPRLAHRLLGQGLKQSPEEAIGWFNLGIGLHQRREIEAAVRAYQHCLTLPHDKETDIAARNNLCQDLLLLDRWEEGWQLYGDRFKRKPGNQPFFLEAFGPSYRGLPPIHKPLLLMSEQGLGDTLQFVRYALVLQQQGHDVTLLSQPSLVPLLKEQAGLSQVVEQLDVEQEQKRQPLWMAQMDLAPQIGCSRSNVPLSAGYIKIDPKRCELWKDKIRRCPQRRLIALHWQGNPHHEQSLYSRGRSMRFEHLLGLKNLDNVEFVSIQKGAGSEQLKRDQGLTFIEGQDVVSASMDFQDTAAVIAQCDLVITSDSSVVHLSGAMGIPSWLALRWIPEWRWGLEGNRTPWYKSLQLFRQPCDGDWESVVQDMRREILANQKAHLF